MRNRNPQICILAALAASLITSTTTNAGDTNCGTWQVTPAPLPPQAARGIVRDIVAVSANDAWAVGDWNGTVDGTYQSFALVLRWDGASWTVVDVPQPAPCGVCHNLALWAVDATGPNDVWVAGGAVKQAPDGFVGTHVLVMHFDGSSWTVMNTPIFSGGSGDIVWGIDAIASDNVWFFGDAHPLPVQPQPALALHWDGSGFDIVPVPQVNNQTSGFGNGNSLRAGSALNANDIWAVGAAGDGDSLSCNLSQIHRWNGSQWVHVPSGPPNGCNYHDLEAVVALGPDDAWAGGDYFDGAYHGLALHWDGSSWSQVSTPMGIRDFVAYAPNDVWAVGGGIAHWDGESWTLVETFPQILGPTFAGASSISPCDIWAGGRQIDEDGRLLPLIVHLVPGSTNIPGDIDGDGSVNMIDGNLLIGVLIGMNANPDHIARSDLNSDGATNGGDITPFVAAILQ